MLASAGAAAMNLLRSARGRRVLFALLYLCEGAPIGFLWGVLPVVLTERGEPDTAVTAMLAIVVLPWTLKLVFAPAVDLLQGRRFSLRGWILCAQLVMAATLLPLAGSALPALTVLTAVLVVHALAAALQDVSIDSLAVRATSPSDRGKTTAAMQVGLLLGRFLFGAAALWLSARYGVRPIVLALIAVLLAGAALSLCYAVPPRPPGQESPSFFGALAHAARLRTTWIGLAFAAVGGAAFEATAGVARPFLSSRGLPRDDIALQFALPGMLLMAVGAWLGGTFADRHGRIRSTFLSGALVAIAVAAVAATAGHATATSVLVALLALHAAIGMFTAATYALFMDLTDRRIAATQFSAFMGATNLCESWSIALCGTWAASVGYPTSFARFAVLGGLALFLLAPLRRT